MIRYIKQYDNQMKDKEGEAGRKQDKVIMCKELWSKTST
jgi:hypothetical protein